MLQISQNGQVLSTFLAKAIHLAFSRNTDLIIAYDLSSDFFKCTAQIVRQKIGLQNDLYPAI